MRVGKPFIASRKAHHGVSFPIESEITLHIYQRLSQQFKDTPPLSLNTVSHPKPQLRPRFTIDTKLTPEEAEQTLKKALDAHKDGIESVTGIGLALRHEFVRPRGVPKELLQRHWFSEWKIFPFGGVE